MRQILFFLFTLIFLFPQAILAQQNIPPVITIEGLRDGLYTNQGVMPLIYIQDTDLIAREIILNGKSYQTGRAITEEGDYILEVFAEDQAGNSSSLKRSFVIDKEAPLIEIRGVEHGKAYNHDLTPEIDIQEKNIFTVSITLNDKPFVSGEVVSEEGDYTLWISALDKAGNSASASATFIIDKSPPLVEIKGVENNEYTNEALTPRINIFDLNLDAQEITLNNNSFQLGTTIDSEGDYVLKVRVLDKAGNETAARVTFSLDTTAPEIEILGVADQEYYHQDITPLITIQDRYLTTEKVRLNRKPFRTGTRISAEGKYVLSASAEDRAGNAVQLDYNFILDKSPPLIEIKGVLQGQYLKAPFTPLITIEDENLVSSEIFLNEKPYLSGTEIFRDGEYSLLVRAEDKAGNSSSNSLSFNLDQTPPQLKIAGVEDNKYYNHEVIPRVEIIDPNLAGQSIILNDLPFVSGKAITEEGDYILRVSALDRAGNMLSQKFYFTLDRTLPEIEIKGVKDKKYPGGYLTPEIAIFDQHLLEESIRLNGESFVSGTAISEEGNYLLEVSARDKAGNFREKSLNFIIDRNAPLIKISGIENEAYTNKEVTPQIEINESHLSDSSILLNEKPFQPGTTISKEGEYNLRVSASDEIGNISDLSYHFIIDRTPPEISVEGIKEGEDYDREIIPRISVRDSYLRGYSVKLNGKRFNPNNVIQEEGDYVLIVSADDLAGNREKLTRHFSLDLTPPVIEVEGIKEGEYRSSDLAIFITIQDKNLTLQSVTLNDKPYTSGTMISEEGDYTLIVRALDNAKNVSKAIYSFVLDKTPPRLSFSGVEDGLISNKQITPLIKISDAHLFTRSVTLNGSPFKSGTILSEEGNYLLSASALDRAGNVSNLSLRFTIDYTPPRLDFSGVEEGSYYNHEVLPEIIVEDLNLIEKKITLNGKPYQSGTPIEKEGSYLLSAFARDKSENFFKTKVSFNIDLTPPLINLSGVEEGKYYNQEVIPEIEIKEDNPAAQSITLNNQPFQSGTIITLDGEYTLKVKARDKAGNSSEASLSFFLDRTPPLITISGISAGEQRNFEVIPRIEIEEENLVEQRISLNGAPFKSNTLISKEGHYTLNVSANDRAGNSNHLSLTFNIDQTLPRISIGGVKEGEYSNEDITPIINITDPNLSEKSVRLNGLPFTSGQTLTREGNYTLSVLAKDEAENSLSSNISFTIDKTPPEIRIKGVKEGEFRRSAIIPVIDINDLNLLASQTELNREDYQSNTPIEQEGEYILFVQAQDRAGNINKLNYHFTLDKTAPRIELKGVKEGEYYNQPVTPLIEIRDKHILKKTILLDGEDFSPRNPISAEGGHRLIIEAEDKAGNLSRRDISFFLDKTPPLLKISGVANNEFRSESITPLLQIEEDNLAKQSFRLNNQPFKKGSAVTEEGNYVLRVSVADKAGNHSTLTYNFALDFTAPQITISGVADGEYYHSDLLPLISLEEKNIKESIITLDDQPYLSGTLIVKEGRHNLKVIIEDKAGNRGVKEVGFFLDKTPPRIEIKGVKQNQYSNREVTPRIEIIEPNLIKKSIILNDLPFQNKTPVSEEGNYLLTVNASDRAGNSSIATLEFTLDRTAPEIEVNDVPNNQFVNKEIKPEIKITDRHLAEEKIVLNRVNFTPGSIISVEGRYILNIAAKDKAGNSNNLTYKFIIDKTPPLIEISGIIPDQYSNQDLTPRIEIKDKYLSAQTITLNGLPYRKGKKLSLEKEYTLIVNAEDRAKNKNKLVYKFIIDKTPPRVKLSGISNNLFSNKAVTPRLEISDQHLSFKEVKLNGGEFKNGRTISRDGDYLLEIKAADKAGNTIQQSYKFSLDLTPPRVIINGVKEGKYYRRKVKPTVTISDANLILKEVSLNGLPFTSKKTLTTEMEYTLTALARDKAGNKTVLNYRFVIDRTPPEIIVSGVTNREDSNFDLTPIIIITDPNLKSKNITLDGAPFESGTTISEKGKHLLRIIAVDKAGNIAKRKIKFTLNK